MLSNIICFATALAVCASEITAPGISREVSDGVKSLGYKLVYGDEDMNVINQAVNDMEKTDLVKSKTRLDQAVPVLPAQDVKCLMAVNRYCSKEMAQMKSVLIQALTEDCVKCSRDDKDKAGRIVASMLAHDPVAWKMFLTRYEGQEKVQKLRG